MNENKKYLDIGYFLMGCLAIGSFGLGYSLGKMRKEIIRNNIFTLGIPPEFSADELNYYVDEIMKQLRIRTAKNGDVSSEEYKDIVVEAFRKTNESKNLVDGLFQTGEV